jgi:hypothetical protein
MPALTETEAKTKWCPYSRYIPGQTIVPGGLGACMASRCMMWRLSQPVGRAPKEPKGYCGLAAPPIP